ncbi:MAG TPA: DNA repair exonuclease [Bacillota bacterium]|nr:DNA repair exonuclease [Bacillota bacterium]
MSQHVSFLHAADLHLDSPFSGLTHVPEHLFHDIRESTFTAFENLVETAIEKEVDFVLLAGDLFDNEKQTLKAQIHLRNGFQKLEKHHINVYVSYGNHDFVNGNVHPITYPDNVYEFTEEKVSHVVFKKDRVPLASIYGFSYENRSVHTNKASEYEIKDNHIPYHIAMLHGSISSNTEHDVYAPFQIRDLTESAFDYWALGHIHKRQVLHTDPVVVYPGNIQGRNRKETGEKGCYHVTLSPGHVETTFIPLETIQFRRHTIDASDCNEIHQLERKIHDSITMSMNKPSPQLISLRLTSHTEQLSNWNKEAYLDEIIGLINESLVLQTNWRYIFRFEVEEHEYPMENDLLHGEHFAGELMRHFADVSIQPLLTDLFQHRKVRKYVSTPSEKEEETIKNKAKKLLIKELLKNGGE